MTSLTLKETFHYNVNCPKTVKNAFFNVLDSLNMSQIDSNQLKKTFAASSENMPLFLLALLSRTFIFLKSPFVFLSYLLLQLLTFLGLLLVQEFPRKL